MDPLLRFLLVVIGAVLGSSLGASSSRIFDAVLGALTALGIIELNVLRSRVASLQAEITRLKKGTQPGALIDSKPQPAVVMPAQLVSVRIESAPPEPNVLENSQRPARVSRRVELPSGIPGVAAIVRFFTGGNTVVRVGVVILFFGVAFLLRYMAEHSHVPVEVRLTGIALGAIILLVLGWRLRTARAGYALALQGGGIGILYLTVFAALRLYAILPAAAAFPLLAVVGVLSATLAVKQESMALALLGITGGFLAPILASTGEGSHVVLFSYYAVLNAGILAMAWFKAWRPLNIAGFVFTFGIGTVWGVLRYRPEAFASTEPFLILFFLFFFSIGILFSFRQPLNLKGFVDSTLIFGTPIAVFAIQSRLLVEHLMSLAFSAVAMSAVYLTAAWILKRRREAAHALMVEAFIAIGIAFLTLAIPLALDASWNAAAWTLEGTALVWVGCRQNRALARVTGALLIVASVCITLFESDLGAAFFALSLRSYFGIVLQSAAAIFAAQTVNAHRDRLRSFEPAVPHALFWLGLFAWFGAGIGEISVHWPRLLISGWLILTTCTALACSELHRVTRFGDAKFAALMQLPMMLVMAIFCAGQIAHPFADFGWLAWPFAFLGLYALMYRDEGLPIGPLATFLETGAAWLFCAVFSWEAAWIVNDRIAGAESWSAATWAVIPMVFLFLLPRLVARVSWPFSKNGDAYLFVVGVGVAAYLSVWSFWTSVTSTGDAAPLPYVPLLNPQDLAQALVLATLLRYWKFLRTVSYTRYPQFDPRLPVPVVAALGFIWLNAALLRTLHQWFGIAFDQQSLLDSTLVQTSLSIFWAILAFVTMLVGARRRRRTIWIVGAALLGVVIAKLFLVDLSRIGSIERIVSFVGVGLLMLVVGYLSPLPPAKESSM